MFLVSLFLKCALISYKSDNCFDKEPHVKFKSTDLMDISDIDGVQIILI